MLNKLKIGTLLLLTLTLTACSPNSVHSVTSNPQPASAPVQQSATQATFQQTLANLEQQYQARIGVYVWDTETGHSLSYRADERFAYASTFKALLAGAVLQSLPEKDLNRTISYSQKDLVSYSPETQKYVGKGMTIAQLCEAAVRFSDNSATNLLLKELGGVEQYQRILRQLGDNVTHANRLEPDLNQAKPNDIRDTSTPKQMAMNLNAYLLGNTLTESQKTILWNWLDNNATGNPLIRAATPTSWKVYDKSGAGKYGVRNDIAVVRIPNRKPIVMAIMSTQFTEEAKFNNKLVDAAKQVFHTLQLN